MREIEIDEAAGSLPRIVDELEPGSEVVLTRNGVRLATLTPVVRRKPVQLGRLAGQFTVPDDFDAPLPDDLLDLFEGKT